MRRACAGAAFSHLTPRGKAKESGQILRRKVYALLCKNRGGLRTGIIHTPVRLLSLSKEDKDD
ncbi:hypothetical protein PB01_19125 [Psychrobacillus glaciei]|uniref:Uncharacterized protein n=1 Tax=Psychrobacillus glaciei TaxID=2283160 RepID=A0A5J6ST52_9BACI|nr:hypothetical protein PB01_19125 [Psychrobacillus glaciei]